MKIYIVNLKRRQDRKDKIIADFKEFKFANYEFIEAIDGNNHTHQTLTGHYSDKHAIRLQRRMSVNEICAVESHKLAHKAFLKTGEQCGIIMEDDCPITKELIDFCNSDFKFPTKETDIILLGYYSSNESNPNVNTYKLQNYKYDIMSIIQETRVYLKNEKITVGSYNFHKFDEKSLRVDFVHGAHCYLCSINGSNKYIKRATPIVCEPDNYWNYFQDIKVLGCHPILTDILRDRDDSDLEEGRSYEQLQMNSYNTHGKCFLSRITNENFGS